MNSNNEIEINNNEIEEFLNDNISVYPKNYDISRPVSKKNCKICSHPNRKEIEDMYAKTQNLSATLRQIKNAYKENPETEKITYSALRRHISNHLNIDDSYYEIKEYGDAVEDWMEIQQSPINSMKTRKAILEKEMISYAAIGGTLSGDEKRKHVELVRKMAETLLSYDAKIEERLTIKEEKNKLVLEILEEFKKTMEVQIETINGNSELSPKEKARIKQNINGILTHIRSFLKTLLEKINE